MWTDSSGFKSSAPSARACGLLTGNVPTSKGCSSPFTARKFVLIAEKYDCASDGARKPVLAEPRTMNRGCTSRRAVNLPSEVLPKSE